MILPFSDHYFMRQALFEAQLSAQLGEVPVGAVIVADNVVIAKAHNLTEKLSDVTAHAEIQAITSACHYIGSKFLYGCTMYVTLEPCTMCAGALYWSRISRLVFAASDPHRGYMSKNIELHPKTSVTKGVLEAECSNLLSTFFKQRR